MPHVGASEITVQSSKQKFCKLNQSLQGMVGQEKETLLNLLHAKPNKTKLFFHF